MFNLGPMELLVVLVVALVVLGPTRLPHAARQVGKAMSELRRWTAGLDAEVRSALEPEETGPLPPAGEGGGEAPAATRR